MLEKHTKLEPGSSKKIARIAVLFLKFFRSLDESWKRQLGTIEASVGESYLL